MFRQDQEIFNLLLGTISEGVIVVDAHQNIVETNDSTDQMFGYPKGKLINQPLNILIPQNYHDKHGNYFKDFLKNKKKRSMGQGKCLYGTRKDGTVFPVEVGINPFKIYDKTFVMALIVDISTRKAYEEKIVELNTNLEKKVKKRTEQLEQAIKELKLVNIELSVENKKRIEAEEEVKSALIKERELNELKTKFLSMVSHEFKTPLSGVLTSAMLLSKYKLSEQQENRDKHIKTITDKVHYLNNILNDFLSVEKLEKGQVKYTPTTFKLSKVVNEVVYSANMLLKEGQKINYPNNIDELSLYQDDKIIELTLTNLVQNAIKYSPENTQIDIIITQNNHSTIFKIKDNGIGIPDKDQKNIFNRYFRAENVLLTQGTGIGLNIVKDHLKNINGTISFVSKEGKGTTFTVAIPNTFKQ
ncbi:PAS domain-containing sensor histidine kinase [Yeosuana sp. MJ-SS3]|uniref:histidine kinase n=1 Tax=Gilvirhabdus luticola TaxID=3079858 RepID=A0ABU3U5K8_9FLAO|nr:PAS domain-containing sensor histidine kinase [Yeosuana sp. MJ-SS3]MDU8885695.1 PAS domain-containing sensor histidine kinase [Yeosuana sp. MJ-SS3]